MINSRDVKKFVKNFDRSAWVKSIKGTRRGVRHDAYIGAFFDTTEELRRLALRCEYGSVFEIGPEAIAGNVQEKSITLPPNKWEDLIKKYTAKYA